MDNIEQSVMITDTKGNYLKWAEKAAKKYPLIKVSKNFIRCGSSYDYFKIADNEETILFFFSFSGPRNIVEEFYLDLRKNVSTMV